MRPLMMLMLALLLLTGCEIRVCCDNQPSSKAKENVTQ
ncbi:hypothetical protein M2351_007066 [Azospirillum canadense]|nr:hypothetical protein [Azospirillum canadense]